MDDPDGEGLDPVAPSGEEPIAATPLPGSTVERRLRRRRPAEIGGVAAGLADYLGVEVLFLRIGFAVLTVLGGSGLVIYLAAWLLLPTEDDPDPRPLAFTSNFAGLIAGFVVLAFGAGIAIQGDTWGLGPAVVIPVVMVMAGVWLLNQRPDTPATLPPPPGPHRGNWPPTLPDPGLTAHPSPPRPATGPAPPARPSPGHEGVAPGGTASAGGPPPWDTRPSTQPWATPIVTASPGPTGSPITSITLAAVAVAGGVFLVLHNVAGIDVSTTLVVGSVLAIVGAGLVVSSFTARALALYPLGIVALGVLFVAPLIDTTLSGGVGTRQVHVASSDGLERTYSMGMGELLVDLGDLQLDESTEVAVEIGAGYAEIVVPADARVEVRATSRAGYVEVFGLADEGVRNEIFTVSDPDTGTERSDGGDRPTLRIDADVTFGYVEVRRG